MNHSKDLHYFEQHLKNFNVVFVPTAKRVKVLLRYVPSRNPDPDILLWVRSADGPRRIEAERVAPTRRRPEIMLRIM